MQHTPALQLESISTRQQIRGGTTALSNIITLFELVCRIIIAAVASSMRTNTVEEAATSYASYLQSLEHA